ncbi:glycoside hydrolase family 16 protein [Verrucomicrobium sp. BvORR106]|uniref:glycoside hydrolase family 16 protein n=1 Tax=Verrucomicrobium sp. BvORR106 TaxID=1403819 RepID=UPI000570A1B1|nr:glycoside hydrolase family 16 protein [Verrucomicrobium sp. BvORR106]
MIRRPSSLFSLFLLPFLLSATAVIADEVEVPPAIRDQGYKLVFRDEFSGEKGAPPDPTKWSQMIPGKWRDLWNVADACQQDGEGNLRIAVRKNGDRFETGYIGTPGKFEATHGYFEARIRLQTQIGFWSAFWLNSPTFGKPVDDPVRAGVEIDVIEHVAYNGDTVHHTAHWNGYKEHHQAYSTPVVKVPGLTKGFHTFAVKWDEKGYVFYVDGMETGRWPQSVPISNCPEYLLLSCESEKWAGDLTKAVLPDDFAVDFVRVWQTPAQIEADQQRKATKGK